jgi:hypothetical protein
VLHRDGLRQRFERTLAVVLQSFRDTGDLPTGTMRAVLSS